MVQVSSNMTADTGYSCMTPTYCSMDSSMTASSKSFDMLGAANSNGYDTKNSTVCKRAVLKKVKTNRNKFFVLHKTSSSVPARLEYYDSESQWNKQKKPKRTIYLQTCFSVNAYSDSSARFGLTLYTKDDSFQIGFPAEQERDMWLADISFLSRANCELARDPVQHQWRVKVSTRNMSCPFCGQYFLLLDQRQATLFKKSDPDGALQFPLDVITRTDHNNNFFIMEVNELSHTGPGEMWMELEDSLIAQHVHRAFSQNIAACEDEFRPVSKSLSYKDRRSAFSLRLRSGSDAKIRSRTEQNLVAMGQKNSLLMSSNVSIGYLQRDRSDSIDSHSTSVSVSTDESEHCCRDRHSNSRSVTPDLRVESWRSSAKKGADNYRSLSNSMDHSYTDMSYCGSGAQDNNSNFVYIDMSAGPLNQQMSLTPNDGYLDMTCGRRSPALRACRPKPDVVKSYLIEDDDSPQPERRHNSVGSRAGLQAVRMQRDNEYVEMCRSPLSVKDKCSSAPHLNPMTLSPKSPLTEDSQYLMDNRLHSYNYSHHSSYRPRGSSWSQCTRPYSDQKSKSNSKRLHKSQPSKSVCADYIDMTCGSNIKVDSSYVEMSLNHKTGSKASTQAKPSGEDKENHIPSSRSQLISEPFPELSASSEDELSLHSAEGSSVYSLTSSGDSMYTSSHSPSYCGSTTGSVSLMDSEQSVRQSVNRSQVMVSRRSLQVPSFIRDELHSPTPSQCSNYMEMSPGSK